MNRPAMVTWWTPLGWETDIEPPAYTAFRASPGTESDYQENGYKVQIPAFPPADEYSAAGALVVWRHADHLMVSMWDRDQEGSVFFVVRPWIAAFRATELPRLMQAMAAVWQAEEVRVLRRAVVAFVRHGQHESTIDEMGTMDRDEAALEARLRSRISKPFGGGDR